tara:strand:+ start:4680 stop:6530 length:1851 start_codon:yes stop_codon:yes gene_type:complete
MHSLITLDYETYFDDQYSLKKLTTVEYIKDPRFHIHGIGIKCDDHPTAWYTGKEIAEAVEYYFYPGNQNTLLAHHTHFDGIITTQKLGFTPARYACTLSESNAIFPGLSSALESLVLRLFPNDETKRKGKELEEVKGIRFLSPELDQLLGNYCINDVDITYDSHQVMCPHLIQNEHDLINLIIRMYTEPHFILDREVVHTHLKYLQVERERIIKASGLDAKTLGSPKKFPAYVESLGIQVPLKKNDKGKLIPAFAKNDTGFQDLQRDHPEYQHIWDARTIIKSTQERSRCKRLLKATLNDNQLPVPLKISGAANSHRLSGDEAINLQNLKRGSPLRKALTAPPGYKVQVADSSQIETRVLCDQAGQDNITEQFRNGDDTYAILASSIYGHPVNKKEHPTKRFVGKTARLGLGYGMGWLTFATELRTGAKGEKVAISDADAKHIVYDVFRPENNFIKDLWGIAEHQWLPHMLLKNEPLQFGPLTFMRNKIILPNGMILRYPNLKWSPTNIEGTQGQWSYFDGIKRVKIFGAKLVENIIQALARIIVFYQMLEYDKWLRLNNIGWVVLTVHDEIVSIISEHAIKVANAMIAKLMRRPPSWAPNLPLDQETVVGDQYKK